MTTHDLERGAEKVDRKRDELEELAESDNLASWVAETLLEAADEHLEQ